MMAALVPSAPLFVPGDRPERFTMVVSSDSDAIIVYYKEAVARLRARSLDSRDKFAIYMPQRLVVQPVVRHVRQSLGLDAS